jgi:hypothetical protein
MENLFKKAVRNAYNEWQAIIRYVQDGRVDIDNNLAERMMKPICVGRNNYLFCGSEEDVRNAALIYSPLKPAR